MTRARSLRSTAPTLVLEQALAEQGHRYVAGCDEVGRGALAGPVSVGIVVVDLEAGSGLRGVRDSKLLSPAQRQALVPRILRWSVAAAVGHASAEEIDAGGLTAALRTAGGRAWASVLGTVRPDAVILDGNHDWLTARAEDASPGGGVGNALAPGTAGCDAPVHPRVKADLSCLSVAAASVLAKVERDALMVELAERHPGFGWELNKGYATAAHRAALRGTGATDHHRRTWRLGPTTPNMPPVEIGG